MRSMGAEVVPVTVGQETLKEAVNEAMRDWVTDVRTALYYWLGARIASVSIDGAGISDVID